MKYIILLLFIFSISTSYQPSLALKLAWASGAAYASDKDISNWNCSTYCNKYPLTKVIFILFRQAHSLIQYWTSMGSLAIQKQTMPLS